MSTANDLYHDEAERAERSNSVDSHHSVASLFLEHPHLVGRCFHPTHLHLTDADGNNIEWQSRRARKHRYSSKTHHISTGKEDGGPVHEVEIRLQKVGEELKPHLLADVSFWLALSFTLGSVIWVINGFLAWLPFIYPSMQTPAVEKTGPAIGFVGGMLFEVGSYLMVCEALDRGRETNFGTALEGLLKAAVRSSPRHAKPGVSTSTTAVTWGKNPESSSTSSPSSSSPSSLPSSTPPTKENKAIVNGMSGVATQTKAGKDRSFVWWGKPLWHELGYVAAVAQLCAASIFWIATVTGLPGVIPGMSDGKHVAIVDVFYWVPQVVGSVGFITSSTLLVIEVQHAWYRPRPLDLGWWIGFWNVIGSLGFLLCAVFGFSHNHGMQYQSALATLWGSWAFLIGSALQFYEVLWREKDTEGKKAD